MNRTSEFHKFMEFVREPEDPASREEIAAAGPRSSVGCHYDESALIDYAEGTISREERAQIETHLTQCAACRELASDVSAFFDPIREEEIDLTEFEVRRGWKDLRGRIPFEPRRQAGFILGTRAALAMAASLLLTTSLAGFFAYRLWQVRDSLSGVAQQKMETRVLSAPAAAPQTPPDRALPNTPVFDLTISPQTRGGATNHGAIQARLPGEFLARLPEGVNLFTLRIEIQSDSFPAYAIEFAAANGDPLWKQANLKPDQRAAADSTLLPDGQRAILSVAIPRQPMKPGRYLFKFYGLRGSQSVPLETLDWVVE
ncbi:MAG: zf-HC2 domain-containing protein [Blastocatellia bacterium]|nr:zf-HC2 domain-containing protein [Blastocatellia bacterium]